MRTFGAFLLTLAGVVPGMDGVCTQPDLTTEWVAAPAPTERKGGEEREFEVAAGVKVRFCWVPPGKAQLGSTKAEQDHFIRTFLEGQRQDWLDSETESARGVFATKGFWLGKYEVTQGEWTRVMETTPSAFAATGVEADYRDQVTGLDTSRFPVEQVSWADCQEFIKRANAHAQGKPGRFALPHENEWEYACRGGKGNGRAFYWGDELNGTQANCDGHSPYRTEIMGPYLERTTKVGSYEKSHPHPWGLCDMHGNVWEWCDNLHRSEGPARVFRGGGWGADSQNCRSATRGGYPPLIRLANLGFRLILVPPGE